MNAERTLHIPTGTALRLLLLVGLALVVYYVREVVVTVFVALVLAAALDPTISWMERRGIPRGTAMLLILTLAFATLYGLVSLMLPLVMEEGGQFARTVYEFYERGIETLRNSPNEHVRNTIQRLLVTTPQGVTQAGEALLGGALGMFSGALGLVGVVVLTLYGSVHREDLLRMILALTPAESRIGTARLLNRIRERLGLWLRGQLILGAIIFAMSYFGLTLLQVKFALVLALIAGITEWIPILGPLLGAIPAVLVAVSQYPMLGVWVIVLYVAIQQLENYLIVPRVIAHGTGLNPLLVIIAILLGAKLAGILGIFLAVPMAVIATTWMEDVLERRAADEAARAVAAAAMGDESQAEQAATAAISAAQAAEAVVRPELLEPHGGSP
jgi:predicted PurR-regulated permease PerM